MIKAAFIFASGAFILSSQGPTFDFSAVDFKSKLDKVIAEDANDEADKTGAAIKSCVKGADRELLCTFKDRAFNKSVVALKKLDLLNGKFSQKLLLNLKSADNKVSEIRLIGNRSDPANLFRFVSVVVNIFEVFDPAVGSGDEAMKSAISELGLMRGDDAGDIGKERTEIKPYAAVSCIYLPSDVSTNVSCRWVPRS